MPALLTMADLHIIQQQSTVANFVITSENIPDMLLNINFAKLIFHLML